MEEIKQRQLQIKEALDLYYGAIVKKLALKILFKILLVTFNASYGKYVYLSPLSLRQIAITTQIKTCRNLISCVSFSCVELAVHLKEKFCTSVVLNWFKVKKVTNLEC